MSWTETLRNKIGSNAKAAKKLHAAWRKKDPKAAGEVREASLATRIGQLVRGQAKWWKERPKLLSALAELLDVSTVELLGEQVVDPAESLIQFDEFPELRPLAPNEEPCSFQGHGWLVHHVLQGTQDERYWIVAPAGSGKTLALQYLALHQIDAVLAIVRTLEEAVSIREPNRALVVEVLEADPLKDRAALLALSQRRTRTTILASFQPPIPDLQWLYYPGAQPFPATQGGGWHVVRAQLPADWRDQLLTWVDARLEASEGDTKLVASEVRRWLEENDAEGRLVSTPGDLLSLCAEAHHHGLGDPLSSMSERWLTRAFAGRTDENPATFEWLNRFGVEALKAMVRTHVLDIEQPLVGLDIRSWEKHLPDRLRPLPQDPERPGDALILSALELRGILRSTDTGLLDVFPRWVRAGLIRSTLTERFEAEEEAPWGALAADESRQAAVDDALDALGAPAFRALVRAVVRGFPETPTLGGVAAVQATFSAAARRSLRQKIQLRDTDLPYWHRLAELQIRFLSPEPSWHELHLPFTRPDDGRWLADAWAYSLRVPPPQGWSRPDLDWEFAGWARSLTLRDAPKRDYRWSDLVGESVGSPSSARTIALLGVEVLDRCEDKELPEELPSVLVPAALRLRQKHGWRLKRKHISRFRYSAPSQRVLASMIQLASGTERVDLADHLWGVVLDVTEEAAMEDAFMHSARAFEALFPTLLLHISEKSFEEALRQREFAQHGVENLEKMMSLLPERLRSRVIRAWGRSAQQRDSSFFEAQRLLSVLDERDVEVVAEILHDADPRMVDVLAPLVWKHDIARARAETESALRDGRPPAGSWFWGAPATEYLTLIRLIEENGTTPEWARTWAQRRMLTAGRASERMFALAWGELRASG